VLLAQTSESSSGDFRNYVPATNLAGAKFSSPSSIPAGKPPDATSRNVLVMK